MRVIAGRLGGSVLSAPFGVDTRPILDRVKTALFDWLGARYGLPGELPAWVVLDLFCGSGSLGIEALSRGARCCTFVDSSPEAIRHLRENLRRLRIGSSARVLSQSIECGSIAPSSSGPYDLVFLDPPYAMSEAFAAGGVLWRLLSQLADSTAIATGGILAWRHDARWLVPSELPGGWRIDERRRWGKMTITLLVWNAESAT